MFSLLSQIGEQPTVLYIVCLAMIGAISKMWLEVRSLDRAHTDCQIKYAKLEEQFHSLRREFDAFKISVSNGDINDEGAWFSVDQDGLIVLWSHQLEELVGFAEQEMLGESIFKIIPERFRQLHHEQLSAIASGHKKMARHLVDVSWTLTRARGELPVTTEVRSYKLYDPITKGHKWYFRVTLERRPEPVLEETRSVDT